MKYAAIDIGTNAARLLVGEIITHNDHVYVQKLSYTRVPLRLGMDVFNDGIIPKSKTEQFVKTMQAFQLIADVYDVKGVRACATSAMREAKNGRDVQQKIQKETGLHVEIIDGEEEANILFSTFFLLAVEADSSFIVIDVGGGSTEVSVFENGQKVAGKSFELGTIRLLKEKTKTSIWKEIKAWIKQHVDKSVNHKVFATGGNINKLHKLMYKRFMEPISYKELKSIQSDLEKLSIDERMENYLLKPDRADVIIPACQIYNYIMKQLKCNELYVPKIGLSDGIIYDLYLKEKGGI
jgi:exopolyphosphatase/guanosine-5'-triphosphate,3'-diphosphate pyrophosphatase